LRASTGLSVVAIGRNGALIGNPSPDEVLQAGDRLAVIGTPSQVSDAEARFLGEAKGPNTPLSVIEGR
jgi:K+/H+ antiporter YhaU regulatory subunit KhtT